MGMTGEVAATHGLTALLDLLRGRRVVAVAGAGCSTESGIPDYRGPEGSLRRRAPMQYGEFVRSAEGRARYWARSAVGWPRLAAARPNAAHHALARLEAGGVLHGVITQNVDGLHHSAGSRNVVELHGSLALVRCLDCGHAVGRAAFQERLLAINQDWQAARAPSRGNGAVDVRTAPDGDVELPASAVERFRVPGCEACSGVVKPDVVFFGENVPRARVGAAWRLFESAEVLLVVGSSLTVFSGRRFIDRAVRTAVPVAVINLGPTRADDVAAVKVSARLGEVLPLVAETLVAGPALAASGAPPPGGCAQTQNPMGAGPALAASGAPPPGGCAQTQSPMESFSGTCRRDTPPAYR